MVGYAQAMYRTVGRFLCTDLAGAAYGHVDSALYCYWGASLFFSVLFIAALSTLSTMIHSKRF